MRAMTWRWWRDAWGKMSLAARAVLVAAVLIGGISLWNSVNREPERRDIDALECDLDRLADGSAPLGC